MQIFGDFDVRDDDTVAPQLRMDVGLTASLPYGSVYPMPALTPLQRWFKQANDELQLLLPTVYEMDGIYTGSETIQPNIKLLEDGRLNLKSVTFKARHQWAEANREASEKRTVPAFLVAALIGAVLTSDFIRQNFDHFLSILFANVVSYLSAKSIFTIPIDVSISTLVLIPLIAIFFIVVLKTLAALFRNIVAQNLIIEACILAEYGCSKSKE